jgi:hypothetical protein
MLACFAIVRSQSDATDYKSSKGRFMTRDFHSTIPASGHPFHHVKFVRLRIPDPDSSETPKVRAADARLTLPARTAQPPSPYRCGYDIPSLLRRQRFQRHMEIIWAAGRSCGSARLRNHCEACRLCEKARKSQCRLQNLRTRDFASAIDCPNGVVAPTSSGLAQEKDQD